MPQYMVLHVYIRFQPSLWMVSTDADGVVVSASGTCIVAASNARVVFSLAVAQRLNALIVPLAKRYK